MKQNERILVYAVTGFLAIILAVAVLFGRDASASKLSGESKSGAVDSPGNANRLPGLNDVLNPNSDKSGNAGKKGTDGTLPSTLSGLLAPSEVSEQPLVAPAKPMVLAETVALKVGPSRRDRTVRFVRAQAGDSLESLVRRWCGKRDPFLEEARCLNEELTVVRLGQEIAVPWVEDEDVLAAYEARQPKMLVAENAGGPPAAGVTPVIDPVAGNQLPTPTPGRPTFASPGTAGNGGAVLPGEVAQPAAGSAGSRTYVVKSGDSLWKIAETLYGRKNADRMVGEIRKLNPGKTDRLQVAQKLTVPVNG
jgi:hypothetical protein